jgi:aerobic-type carbon monoxide dehydrogenase small subunit (CoxS/CutS family)
MEAPVERTIAFTLNGKPARVTVDDDRTLLWVLRGDLGLTGTKFGCGAALCGVCTVIVDGDAVRSCTMPVKEVAGKSVLTIEGLGAEGKLHPIQEAFVKHGAFQCGYCTPGMILTTYALLRKTPRPTREQIIDALDGNLCRCGAHVRILEAVEEAAAAMTKEGAR